MKDIMISSVSCSRGGTFDAELQLKWGDFENPNYKQVLISTGHASFTEARKAADVVAASLEQDLVSRAISFLSKYREAKP